MADSTLDLTRIRLIERAWYVTPHTSQFFDDNYLTIYYEIRGRYCVAYGITIDDFEANFKTDTAFVDFLIDKIYIAYGTKSMSVYDEMVHTYRQWQDYGLDIWAGRKIRPFYLLVKWAQGYILAALMTNIMQLAACKQAQFGTWIASLAEDTELVKSYCDDLETLNTINNVLAIPFYLAFTRRAVHMFSDSLLDTADAYRAIAEVFEYKGVYKLNAVVEQRNDNDSLLAILPQKTDKMTFPTNHIPEAADIGTILNLQIAEYSNPDLQDFIKKSGTVIDVYDGDTFTLNDGTKVRVLPINAPELGAPEGIISQNKLSGLILNKMVDCYSDPANPDDRFGRMLAYVYRNNLDVGQWMMDNGYAELYRLTNAWFQAEVSGVDAKYTTLDPIEEENRTSDEPYVNIRIPNYFIPFAAEVGDVVYLRVKLADSVFYKTKADCLVPGEVRLYIMPLLLEYIKVNPDFLEPFVPSPCNKFIKVQIHYYYACETEISAETGEVKAQYDRIDGLFSVFKVLDTAYEIFVPTPKIPANVTISDYAVFKFTLELPYAVINVKVASITSPHVWVSTSGLVLVSFILPEALIPFPIIIGDKIDIEVGKNIGDYFVADFHCRLGNNTYGITNFMVMPEDVLPINIPLSVLGDIIQDPALPNNPSLMQINDVAYFKIVDKSFTNSFRAALDRIEGANGYWNVLPGERFEITIPSVVTTEFLSLKQLAEFYTYGVSVTISLRKYDPTVYTEAEKEIEIVSTDANDTAFKMLHIKFGTPQLTFPTPLFSWAPAVGDKGVLNIIYYGGMSSETMYVDSVGVSDAKLISIGRKEKGIVYYPINKLPKYLKRFDVVRLQIRQHGIPKIISGLVAQDIVDKYTKIKTSKKGKVKRKVPSSVPNPLSMFVIVRKLDNGYEYAITQRTDNQGYVDFPIYMLPWDTQENDDLALVVDLYAYNRTYFTARFMSLTLPDTCNFLVEPSGNYPFSVPLSLLPGGSVIDGIISFKFQKKTSMETFEPKLEITSIGVEDITFKTINFAPPETEKTFTIAQALLPYVRLPAPDNDIINLQVGDKFRLSTAKIS